MKRVFLFLVILITVILSVKVSIAYKRNSVLKNVINKETVGPNGEKATTSDNIILTEDKIEKVKSLNLTAAVLLHDTTSDFSNALIRGIEIQSIILGIEIKMIRDCSFDPVKQNRDYLDAINSEVDIIFTLVVDTEFANDTLKIAVNKGIDIVLLSNLPEGFVHGRDYASLITDDLFLMGQYIAEMIIHDLNYQGSVLWFYHDSNYFVTNQRDAAVKYVLESSGSKIKIINEIGLNSIDEVSEKVRSAIIKNPEVDAIYIPWDTLAIEAVKVLRELNRKDINVYTMDLGVENVEDMLNSGNIKGIVADYPYKIGSVMTCIAGQAALGLESPAFVTVGATKVDKNNVKEKWVEVFSAGFPLK